MADAPQSGAIVPFKSERDFISSYIVKCKEGEISVPSDAEQNRLASQLMGAKMRTLLSDQVSRLLKNHAALRPQDLKELTFAVAKVEEINRLAHSTDLHGEGGSLGVAVAIGGAMAKGVAQGLASGSMPNAMDSRMRRVLELGKKSESKPKTGVIEVIDE